MLQIVTLNALKLIYLHRFVTCNNFFCKSFFKSKCVFRHFFLSIFELEKTFFHILCNFVTKHILKELKS